MRLIKILTAGWAIALAAALLVVLLILWLAGPTKAERLGNRRWFREGVTALARAGGFSPTGGHWVERVKHLRGEFHPTPIESFPPWFMIWGGAAASVALAVSGIRDLRNEFLGNIGWLEEAGAAVLLALSIFLVYWTWRRYIFAEGSVRCIWGKDHELWREDLTDLREIVCSGGAVTWMKLRWTDRSRRVRLFDSIRKALDSNAAHTKR